MRYQKPHLYVSAENFRMIHGGNKPTTNSGGTWAWSAAGNQLVYDNIDDHKKVLAIVDDDGANYVYGEKTFGQDVETGSFECWFRSDAEAAETLIISVLDGSHALQTGCLVYTGFGNIAAADGGGIEILGAFTANKWYHLYIYWEMSQLDKWYVELDGVEHGPLDFANNPTNMDRIYVGSHPSQVGDQFTLWLDGLDYSWTSGYFKNRNKIIYSNIINRYNVNSSLMNENITC